MSSATCAWSTVSSRSSSARPGGQVLGTARLGTPAITASPTSVVLRTRRVGSAAPTWPDSTARPPVTTVSTPAAGPCRSRCSRASTRRSAPACSAACWTLSHPSTTSTTQGIGCSPRAVAPVRCSRRSDACCAASTACRRATSSCSRSTTRSARSVSSRATTAPTCGSVARRAERTAAVEHVGPAVDGCRRTGRERPGGRGRASCGRCGCRPRPRAGRRRAGPTPPRRDAAGRARRAGRTAGPGRRRGRRRVERVEADGVRAAEAATGSGVPRRRPARAPGRPPLPAPRRGGPGRCGRRRPPRPASRGSGSPARAHCRRWTVAWAGPAPDAPATRAVWSSTGASEPRRSRARPGAVTGSDAACGESTTSRESDASCTRRAIRRLVLALISALTTPAGRCVASTRCSPSERPTAASRTSPETKSGSSSASTRNSSTTSTRRGRAGRADPAASRRAR